MKKIIDKINKAYMKDKHVFAWKVASGFVCFLLVANAFNRFAPSWGQAMCLAMALFIFRREFLKIEE